MSKRKYKGTKPGPGVTRAKGRANKLVQTGRSLPPTGLMTDMAGKLPRHFWQTRGFKKWRKRVILTIIVLILLVGGFLGWKFYDNISRLFGGNVFGIFNTTKLRGEDTGHVNILIAGYSKDDPGHGGADLTDSIMIASINTKKHSAFLLSIPRDLWVNIPGHGYAKINETFQDGERDGGSTKAGMKLLSQVVSSHFGLPIEYYALVNYAAIKDAVNAVGGIDITVKSSDPRGIYDPNIDWSTGGPLVKLSNGKHHLNGREALDLARARGDSYYSYGYASSDYTRTSYQRQMLIALKDKATASGTLLNPFKLADLLDAVGNNVKTNFKTSEIHRLYDLSKDIKSNSVKSYGLNDVDGKGKSLVTGDMYNGQSIQIPTLGIGNFEDIQAFVNNLLNGRKIVQPEATTPSTSS